MNPFLPTVSEQKSVLMTREYDTPPTILVVEDVHETRDGIEKLLMADGYRVALAMGFCETRSASGSSASASS